MHPDFLIIPKVVHRDKKLRPTDWVVYATIYWYEHMKDGKCFAGNEALAETAQVSERAVMSSLERLENQGYIRREYNENKSRRTEIKSLVMYAKTGKEKDKQESLPGIERPRTETPGEFAKRFFGGNNDALKQILEQILLRTHGRGEEPIRKEMIKFIKYWTEPNKSGTKEKWQLQQTFDVMRRLDTWLSRAGTMHHASKSGSGVTV